MAATLRRIGFDVEEKTDLGYVAMNKAVEGFGKRLAAGGVGLFYYAGHGVQVQGANYLLPVDAEIDDENEVRYKAVDAGLVLAKMEQARGDVNLVVLDACRNNPFARSFRSAARGLASMDAPSGSMIAYATAPGKTAADGSGRNGVYTEELIRMMETPGLSVEEAFKRVRKAVMTKTASAQVPWESSSLTGDFRFVSPSSMTDLQPSEVQPAPVAPTPRRVVEEAPPPAPRPAARSGSFTDQATGMEFVRVTGGCFQMGDNFGDGDNDEKPVHEACVSDFAIGKYEVTQGQYKRIMGSNPSHLSSCGDNCPVENVSWNDSQDFIRKLNSQSGRNYRLPTEAEWEYAARSGGKQEKYSGGDNVDAVAWYSGNSGSKTHAVGQKQANGLGIYDMSGNVWEWVNDWKGNYTSGRQQDPQGPSTGSDRVFRGGGWGNGARGVRVAFRSGNSPDFRLYNLGFRLAVSPVQ
jgi:formylglycine-generating enzyme required for sulfatase activity